MKTVVLLAGASNAGKTTLAAKIKNEFSPYIAHICVDEYYFPDPIIQQMGLTWDDSGEYTT